MQAKSSGGKLEAAFNSDKSMESALVDNRTRHAVLVDGGAGASQPASDSGGAPGPDPGPAATNSDMMSDTASKRGCVNISAFNPELMAASASGTSAHTRAHTHTPFGCDALPHHPLVRVTNEHRELP